MVDENAVARMGNGITERHERFMRRRRHEKVIIGYSASTADSGWTSSKSSWGGLQDEERFDLCGWRQQSPSHFFFYEGLKGKVRGDPSADDNFKPTRCAIARWFG
jgi:hypothetical protein